MTAMRYRTRRRTAAGYSLMELMAVVAIIGILSALAVVGYMKWLQSAKIADAKDLMQALASGQHQYYQDTEGYLSCSNSFADLYPMARNGTEGRSKHLFHNPSHHSYACFRLLNASAESATYMYFAVRAGSPGTGVAQPPTQQQITEIPEPGKPWFVIYGETDKDGDGSPGRMYTTSMKPGEVHMENPDE